VRKPYILLYYVTTPRTLTRNRDDFSNSIGLQMYVMTIAIISPSKHAYRANDGNIIILGTVVFLSEQLLLLHSNTLLEYCTGVRRNIRENEDTRLARGG
jgi:hypothetical protein